LLEKLEQLMLLQVWYAALIAVRVALAETPGAAVLDSMSNFIGIVGQ
jgi:hypothetical protein